MCDARFAIKSRCTKRKATTKIQKKTKITNSLGTKRQENPQKQNRLHTTRNEKQQNVLFQTLNQKNEKKTERKMSILKYNMDM